MNRRERRASAREPRMVSAEPIGAFALYEGGMRHLLAAEYLDAQLCCQQALATDPDHADALHLMGLLQLAAGQHDHALEWIAKAIRRDIKPEYLVSLGRTLRQLRRYEEALKAFDKAIQLRPKDAGLWSNLGDALVDLQRTADAVLSLQHALKLDPRCWAAANQCGILQFGLGQFDEALFCFSRCDELQPDHALTLYMRGRAFSALKRYDEALADSERANVLDPGNAEISNSIGTILQMLGRHDEALRSFDEALGSRADFVEALTNKATSLGHFKRFEEAIGLFDQVLKLRTDYMPALVNKARLLGEVHRFDEAFAIHDLVRRIDPGNADAEWNLSVLYLLTGNFEAGWVASEARWRSRVRPKSYPVLAEPRWLGQESVQGKTILIYADEGFGDSIQLARYIPMVVAEGARVILVVGSTACALFDGMQGVSQCLGKPLVTRQEFDFHCPISSLPLIFKTRLDNIPSGVSYLPPVPESRVKAWNDRLGPRRNMRVGLVWSGSPTHQNDHNRSIPLRKFLNLIEADASFISLQKDPRTEDAAVLRESSRIVDISEHLTDFIETSALISCLDLVITVDTSVAHLAGALGCETWILLPYTPDYRWLLNRDDSPWYPTVCLFRQTETRDYAGVIDRVHDALNEKIEKWVVTSD